LSEHDTPNPESQIPVSDGGTMRRAQRPRLVGEVLVGDGHITEEELSKALAQQRSAGQMLGELLVDQGTISGSVLVHSLAKCLGVPGVQLRHGLIDPNLLSLIGSDEAERLKAIPMFRVHDTLTVAMAEPQSLPTIDRLRELTGLEIRPVLAIEANILEFAHKYAEGMVDVDAFLTSLAESDVEVVEREQIDEGPTTDLDQMVEGSPIVNLVNVALLTSVKEKASDIHIEPSYNGTRIRYRIDGSLRDLMKPPPGMHAAIVSRVKIIGKMDIAEKRLPQEGRVRIVAEGREIDLRVSSIPTLLGEKLVIRILDKQNLRVRMEDLGFRPQALEAFQRTLRMPHGMVLVTGPTGSGKTTTLYSALDLLRSPELNIVTVEDPVEYQLDLINQIQVHDAIGLNFARTLRSILRQDPDTIMIGEIRDEETAHVAVQAALTGHGVLATLHTNDAPGAVARLCDMGVEPYLLSSALNGVVAQRLARTICPSCSMKYFPTELVLTDAGIPDMTGKAFRKGAGCSSCHDTGFSGRMGIYEFMEVTPELRRLIYRSAPTHQLRKLLMQQGQLSLRDEGVKLAIDQHTCLEEVIRVTQVDDNEEDDSGTTQGVAA
jgi:type IV pilus assembly protein PilB